VRLDLKQWKAQLAATAAGKATPVLARLQLAPVPPPKRVLEALGVDAATACQRAPVLGGVDLFTADLSAPGSRDRLVQARFLSCTDDYQNQVVSLRVRVLRPLAANEWCLVEGDLDVDQAGTDTPCLGQPTQLPRTFSFARVTDARRRTIVVRDQGGHCDGVHRRSLYQLSYWDVQADKLRSIFDLTTHESEYKSPSPPFKETSATVTLGGAYPRQIAVRQRVSCRKVAPDEPKPDEPCRQSTRRARYVFVGGQYVAR